MFSIIKRWLDPSFFRGDEKIDPPAGGARPTAYPQRDILAVPSPARTLRGDKYRAIFESAGDAIFIHDLNGRILAANARSVELLGYTRAELEAMSVAQVDAPSEAHHAPQRIQQVLRQGSLTFETYHQRKDGTSIPVEVTARTVSWDGAAAIISICRDISQRKQMEQSLLRHNQEMATLYETSLEINALSDLSVLLNTILRRACALLDISSAMIHLLRPEENIFEAVAGHNLPPTWIGMKFPIWEGLAGQVGLTKKPIIVEDYRNWGGRLSIFNDSPARRTLGLPLVVHDDVIGVLVLIDSQVGTFSEEEVRLVSLFAGQAAVALENARLYAQLQTLAITDALTGLYNRSFFDAEVARTQVSRDFPVSLIVADLDNMKSTNDSLGHAAGDQLLKSVARALRQAFRASDIIARTGGDEFAVLLPNTDETIAGQMVARVYAQLADYNYTHPDLPVMISLGTASAVRGKLDETLALADQRMYANKARRKGTSPI